MPECPNTVIKGEKWFPRKKIPMYAKRAIVESGRGEDNDPDADYLFCNWLSMRIYLARFG